MAVQAKGFALVKGGEPLVQKSFEVPTPGVNQAIVKVRACGLCHTDLGYALGGTPTKHALPLILGHEVVGTVVEAGQGAEKLLGKDVIVPAVMPCGTCEFCKSGRGNACPKQAMPGNDIDGGFATHMLVPANALVSLANLPANVDLDSLSVVADAVSTAYQAVKRANLVAGDLAFVVGAGGVGGFVIQIAKALGATVVAFDVSDERLRLMSDFGAKHRILTKDRPEKEVRKEASELAKSLGIATLKHKIFECSGHPAGQTLAYALINRGATMVQVGYTPDTVQVRLSNLMAFDATVHGTWGCPPELYPEVLGLIAEGKVQIAPFVQTAKLSQVNQLLDDMQHHRLSRRMVMTPDL